MAGLHREAQMTGLETVGVLLVSAYAGHVAGKLCALEMFERTRPKLGSDYKRDDDLICRLKREAKQRGEGIAG